MSTIILIVGLASVGLAVFLIFASIGGLTAERGGVNRSVAVLDVLTRAPDELKAAVEKPFAERVLAPALGQIQTITNRITPSDNAVRIREKLEMAGNPPGWTVERIRGSKALGFLVMLALTVIGCMLFGLSLMPMMAIVVVGSMIGYFIPNLFLYQLAYSRTEALRGSLADSIDLLTISVESGLAFDAACAQVARNTQGPLSGEFARMLQEMQIGKSRSDALRSLADRTSLPELRSFVGAMVQADAFGIPMGQVLRVQSSEMRVKRRQWAEEKAQKVPVKILVPLIFCILPCLFIAVLGPAAITIMTKFSGM